MRVYILLFIATINNKVINILWILRKLLILIFSLPLSLLMSLVMLQCLLLQVFCCVFSGSASVPIKFCLPSVAVLSDVFTGVTLLFEAPKLWMWYCRAYVHVISVRTSWPWSSHIFSVVVLAGSHIPFCDGNVCVHVTYLCMHTHLIVIIVFWLKLQRSPDYSLPNGTPRIWTYDHMPEGQLYFCIILLGLGEIL